MTKDLLKDFLRVIGFVAWAMIFAMDWKTDGWFGKTVTVVTSGFAMLSILVIVAELASL